MVIFGPSHGQGTVTVSNSGVQAAAMYFWGNANYILSGGPIIINKTGSTFNPSSPSANGKLVLGAYPTSPALNPLYVIPTLTLDLTGITGTNSFQNGIEINSGALKLANNDQLGTSLSLVDFKSSANASQLGGLKTAITSGVASDISAAADTARGIGYLGTIQVAAAGNLTLNGTGTAAQRLNVADGNAGGFDLQNGATMAVSNSVSGGNGGAISVGAGSLLALNAADDSALYYTFKGNQANYGGAVISSGYLAIQSAGFNSNHSSNYGGAIYNDGNALALTNVHFRGNQGSFGGALYNSKIGGTATLTSVVFSANTATTSGGAINNADGTMNITGGTFEDNVSSGSGGFGGVGGAIVNAGTMTISDSDFTGNRAASSGGAIFNRGGLTLKSQGTRNMLFSGNLANTSQANSIYLDGTNSTRNPSLIINTEDSSTIDMRDPLSGLAQNNGSLTVTKSGTGTWKLGGSNTLNTGTGGLATAFNVNGGTLHLYRAGEVSNGSAGAVEAGLITMNQNASSSFTLASGARLDLGGGNAITASQVSLAGGSTLGFDLAGINTAGQTGLTITAGSGGLNLDNGTDLNFNIDLHSWQEGTFVLVDSQIIGKFNQAAATAAQDDITLNGVIVNSSTLPRATVELQTANNGQQLVLKTLTNNNEVITWTGAQNTNWVSGTNNWKYDGNNPIDYLGGDAVIFNGSELLSQRDITVVGGAAVASMTVTGNGIYTFSGGSIVSTDVTKLTGADVTYKTEILTVKDSAKVTFKNLVDFKEGLTIKDTAEVTLGDGGSFSDRMVIDNESVLNFQKSTAYNQIGDLVGSGIYNHTGSGALTISGANTADGTLKQASGSGDLYLATSWDGGVTQESGAGIFHAADGISIAKDSSFNGVIDVQSPTAGGPGTLAFGDNLALSGATLNMDLFDGNRADKITVANNLTFIGQNTINLTSWAIGTDFLLIEAGGFTNSINTTATLNGQALGGRAFATVTQDSTSVKLTTSIDNEDLIWNVNDGQWNYDVNNDTNWYYVDGAIYDDSFHPLDAVSFTDNHEGVVAVDPGGVQVSSMKITGGEYTYVGGKITGQAHIFDNGAAHDGTLNITGPDTKALFNNSIDFAAGVNVSGGATIGGDGFIKGKLTVGSGSVVSPGNSIGTLNVDGDVDFASGSFFDVELNPTDQTKSDLLEVTGTATLSSGATVRHIGMGKTSAEYSPLGRWVILSANNLSGTFNSEVQSNYQFLNESLHYENNEVILQIIRNGVYFSTFGATGNQRSVAGALDSLTGGALHNTLISLPVGTDFADLYDQLSGEVHASLTGSLLNYDRAFGAAMRGRLLTRDHQDDGYPLWITIDAGQSKTDATRNTAKAKLTTVGVTLGAEKYFSEAFRAGLALRYADNELKVDRRRSKAEVDSFSLGLYGDWNILKNGDDALKLTFGGSYGLHQVESTRRIVHPALNQNLKADYDVKTAQLFAELGYVFNLNDCYSLEPYAGLSWNSAWSDSFKEKGGSAALRGKSEHSDNFSSSLGLRSLYQPTDNLALKADVSWLHIYGDRDPETTLAFSGSDSFTVLGAPLSRNAANLNLAAELKIIPTFSIEAGYEGLLGSDYQSHGGRVTMKFEF